MNWVECLANKLRVFPNPLEVLGVRAGTVVWPMAARKIGVWYRGVVKGANCYMVRCPRGEADGSFVRHEATDTGRNDHERVAGGGSRTDRVSMNAETKR